MGTLIFVGGASATGKSTFVKELQNRLNNSIVYRRVQSFYDIAKERNIPTDMIFKKVTSEEVDDYFLTVCNTNDFVISDVHYAIQMDRDNKQFDDINIYQEYVPTISESLIGKLQEEEIKIIALYLYCTPKICFDRAIKRFNNHERELRAKSIDDVELEISAEKNQWDMLMKNKKIVGMSINTKIATPEQLTQQFIDDYGDILNDKSNQFTLFKKK